MRVLFFKEQEGSGHPLFSCFLFGRFLPTNSKLFIEFTAEGNIIKQKSALYALGAGALSLRAPREVLFVSS